MSGSAKISPAAAGIIIAVVVVLLIVVGVRTIRGPSKVELSADQMRKMQAMGQNGPTVGGGRVQVSRPPAGAFLGR